MAAPKTLYLKEATAAGSNHLSLQDGGVAPTAATTTTGQVVGTVAATKYARMDSLSERASSALAATVEPSSGPDDTLGDCFRSELPISGDFAAANWSFSIPVQGDTRTTSTTGGKLRIRVWRATSATGASAVEISTSTLVTTGYTNLANSAAQTLTVTWAAPAVTLTGEYLFVQVAHQLDVAGNNVNADVHFRVGSSSSVTTSTFTPRLTGTVTGSSTTGGTVTGKATKAGTATGSTTSGGTATGKALKAGTASGSTTTGGTATGKATKAGTASGGTTTAGTVTGKATRTGTASGSSVTAGTVTGSEGDLGTVSGSTITEGSVTGTAARAGTVIGDTAAIGTVTGTLHATGSLSGSTTTAGTVSGAVSLPEPPVVLSPGGRRPRPLWRGTPSPPSPRFSGSASGTTYSTGRVSGTVAFPSQRDEDELLLIGAI